MAALALIPIFFVRKDADRLRRQVIEQALAEQAEQAEKTEHIEQTEQENNEEISASDNSDNN